MKNEDKHPDEETANSLSNYHNRALEKLFSAILHANLPAQDYSLGERRALRDFKDKIRDNRKKFG